MKLKTNALATILLICSVLLSGFSIRTMAPAPFESPAFFTGDEPTPPPALGQRGPKIFLPFINQPAPHSISGLVTDTGMQPLEGVTITSQDGRTTRTGADGRYILGGVAAGAYELAAEREGYRFAPPVVSVVAPAKDQNFSAQAVCSELIANGSFETDAAWELPLTAFRAVLTTEGARTGSRSLRAGIPTALQNVASYSSGRQKLTIPAGSASARLRLWLYPVTTETSFASSAQPDEELLEDLALANDVQYVLVLDGDVLDPATGQPKLLETLLWMRSNGSQWSLYEFDLKKWAGKNIWIQAGVYNDGLGGITSLYVDDVSLEACPADGTIPPTPTPTPVPGGCSNPLSNSSFEWVGSWGIPTTPYPAGYAVEPVRTGARSMRTGIANKAANVYSYSDAYQSFTIPRDATSARVQMWVYPTSGETSASLTSGSQPGSSPPPQRPSSNANFGQEVLPGDVQYLLLLDTNGNILDYLHWDLSNARAWTALEFDLFAYRGRTVRLQFGTYNNGLDGVSAMYVDDVTVELCSATPPPPPPAVCSQRVDNGGFENSLRWEIPLTAFSAGYSTTFQHFGSRSMRSGIYYQAHNRFSYSDFRQTVSIPAGTRTAKLSMWLLPISGEAALNQPGSTLAQVDRPTGDLNLSNAPASDVQYLLVLDRWGNWIDTLIWQRSNAQAWGYRQFDLSSYAGETISLQFGTFNDGRGGVTALYVDDVALEACP